MKRPKFTTVTYLGVPARTASIGVRGGANPSGTGERVALIEWLGDADPRNGGHPAGTVVATHIRGDGRTADFEVFATETFTSVEEALQWTADLFGLEVTA